VCLVPKLGVWEREKDVISDVITLLNSHISVCLITPAIATEVYFSALIARTLYLLS